MAEEHKSSMPESESKSSENPEPISPGGDHGHQEGEGVPSDGHEPGDPSVGSTAEPVSLYSALVEVCGREKYPDQEAGEMIKKYLRNVPTLLLKTASTGNVEVWKTIVKAVKSAGDHLLFKALMAKETDYFGKILTTLMTEAVTSEIPAMVKEVQKCANENLFQRQAREMVLTGVRKLRLLLKAANTGNMEMWKTVVAAVEAADRDLLKEALQMGPWRHDTVLTSAVLSKKIKMVKGVFECVTKTLSQSEANEVVRKSVHDAGLLVKAATTGATEVWGVVLYELRGRGLLQEAPRTAHYEYTRGTVLTGAVESKEPSMLEEVLKCIRNPLFLSLEETNDLIQKSVREGLLAKAARTGVVRVWKIIVQELQLRSLLQEALQTTYSYRAAGSEIHTVLPAAVQSMEDEMLHDALLRSFQVNFDMFNEVLRSSRGPFPSSSTIEAPWTSTLKVLTAAVESMEIDMLHEVLKSFPNSPSHSAIELNEVIENSVRDAGLFAKTARTGNIDVWAEVVKVAGQSVDRTAAETAQRLRDHVLSWRGPADKTVLTAAADSGKPEMFKAVVDFVRPPTTLGREAITDEIKSFLLASDWGETTVLHGVAKGGNTGMWMAVAECFEDASLLEEALKMRRTLFGETVLHRAVRSKEPAMFDEVIKCMRKAFSDGQEVRRLLLGDDLVDKKVLHLAAQGGHIGMWEAAVKAVEDEGLLDQVLGDNRLGGNVLASAAMSTEPTMVKNVIECVQRTFHDQKNVESVLISCLRLTAHRGSVAVWATLVDVLKEKDLLKQALKDRAGFGDGVLRSSVWSGSCALVQEVLDCVQKNASGPNQNAERYEEELLQAWRDAGLELRDRDRSAKMLVGMLQLSVRPSYGDIETFKLLSAADGDCSADDWLSSWCLHTVTSADNPFVPGMTLSVLLSEHAESTSEGERRRLTSLRDRIDALLLEVLERLPKTVQGFEGFKGGAKSCHDMFEPEGPAPSPRHLLGPLAVALKERHQIEVFCTAPLVMDFLSLVFTKGLPDLRDSSGRISGSANLRNRSSRKEEDMKYLYNQGLVITLYGSNGFMQGTDSDFGKTTVLPGAQFIAAGVAAKPCHYYHVPALRMALDFLVYVGMLAFFCTFVLLFEDGEAFDEDGAVIYQEVAITWGEIVFAVYVLAGIWIEMCEVRRELSEYLEDGWNILDVLGLLVSLGGFFVRCFDPGSAWGRSLYALSAPLLVSRILFFAQILPFQGPMVQVLFLMMREMFRFAMVLLVVMLGFTLSFHALFRADDTYGRTCLNLFKAMLGEVGFFDEISEDRYENRYKEVATVLLVVYLIIITIVLLNLLVAVLSTKHAEVQGHADQEYRVLKARLIKHYRFVAENDMLPAPFNVIQILFWWCRGAKRRVGYAVFWFVVGLASVVGGALLWVVSACLLPFPQLPEYGWENVFIGYSVLFVWRLVWCPLQLFGWWLTRPLVCGFFTGGGWDSAVGKADGSNIRGGVRVDDMLEASGEPSVEELRLFLVDPVSDDTVREDEREKPTTLEHMKLLRYYLDRKVGTLQKGATAMNERLDEIAKWISQRGCQGGEESRRGR